MQDGERWVMRLRRAGSAILRPFLDARERSQVLRDLEELGERRGWNRARFTMWYLLEVMRLVVTLAIHRMRDGTEAGEIIGDRTGGGKAGQVAYDIRHAWKRLIRNPAYTGAILLTLTVTTGAATAVFSAVNGVLMHPLPHPDAERLVRIHEVNRRGESVDERSRVTAPNFEAWRSLSHSFDGVAAFQTGSLTYSVDGGTPERATIGFGSADLLGILGVEAAMGRLIAGEEYEAGNDNVLLLGYSHWRTRFNGDAEVIGRTIDWGSTPMTIVGVLPAGFRFLDADLQFWTPLTISEFMSTNRRSHVYSVVGRLRSGVTAEAANRDLNAIAATLATEYPQFMTGWGVNVVPMIDDIIGSTRAVLLLLLGAAIFVVLLGGVNVAAVALTRTLDSALETDVRTAIGATPGRLLRERFAEGALLAVAASAAGLGVSAVATRGLLRLAPDTLPRAQEIHLDARVLMFALVTAVATSFIGTVTTFRTRRRDIAAGLRAGGRTSTSSRSRQRWHAMFLSTQTAFALTLAIAAGLMLRSFDRLVRVDPGFRSDHVLTTSLQLPGLSFPTVVEQSAALDVLLSNLVDLPSIEAAGYTNALPLADAVPTWGVQVVGQPEPQTGEDRAYGRNIVSHGYFEAMGMDRVAGRLLEVGDRADRPMVVVINESFVRRFFRAGDDPVGQRMYIGSRPDEVFEIVGVVRDVRHASLDASPEAAYFLDYRQLSTVNNYLGGGRIVVRTMGEPGAAAESVRRVIAGIDANAVVYDVRPMSDRVSASDSVARARFVSLLLSIFGAVALALTAIGVYGVVMQWARRRRREIGIRLTMGATPSGVVRGLLVECMRTLLPGLVVGLLLAGAFARLQASLLFGVEPFDAPTYAMAVLVVTAGALAATMGPAVRAGRTDPAVVLRSD